MGEEFPSPDGQYIVLLACMEMRMSHTVCVPLLKKIATDAVVFNLEGTFWSADVVQWSEDNRQVLLDMRLYPGTAPGVKVTLYVQEDRAVVERAGEMQTLSIQQAEACIKNWA